MHLVFLLRELICALIARNQKKMFSLHELDNNLVQNLYYNYYSTAKQKEVFIARTQKKKGFLMHELVIRSSAM